MPTQEGRITKLKARRSQTSAQRVPSQKSQVPLVERTNALSIEDFISFYVSPHQDASSNQSTKTPRTNETESVQPKRLLQSNAARDTSLEIYCAATIPTADLDSCLDLVELTSSEAYAASGAGWSRPKKRKEMKLPDMKYLIVRDCAASSADMRREPGVGAGTDKADGPKIAARSSENVNGGLNGSADEHVNDESGVLGFLSFMITYEDGKEVVYCYEIHLAAAARGRGLGALLMSRMEEIGRSVGVKKAMLTVFKSNVNACRFYEKGGYVIDEYSPQPRRLRNGTIKEFDYAILSKRLE